MKVTNHYMKHGTCPIMALLYCSKAFNMCKYSILFSKLLGKGLHAVVVRTIIMVYEKQCAGAVPGFTLTFLPANILQNYISLKLQNFTNVNIYD